MELFYAYLEVMRETDLYPVIRQQWKGICVRMDAPSRPGISDLVLVGSITVFAEIKLALTLREKLQVTAPQFRFIQKVVRAGGYGCVLVYVRENRHWYMMDLAVLEREWPTVRAVMGCNLGTNLATLEASIRSIIPPNGYRQGIMSSDAIDSAAYAVAPVSQEKGQLG